jgi:hypothetical protein
MRQAPRPDVDGWGPGIPPALLKVHLGNACPEGWPPGCRCRQSRGRGPVPHAHSHGSDVGRSFAPTPGLANPARSLARLAMTPTLWGPSSRLPTTGRMDAADRLPAGGRLDPDPPPGWHRDRQGHFSHPPRGAGRYCDRAAAVALPCPSQAPATPAPLGPAWPSRLLRDFHVLPCSGRNPCPGSLPRPPVRDPTPGATQDSRHGSMLRPMPPHSPAPVNLRAGALGGFSMTCY